MTDGATPLEDRVRRIVAEAAAELEIGAQDALVRRLVELVEDQALLVRAGCISLCRRRAELWRATLTRPGVPAPARAEARYRFNEASYLADHFASGATGLEDEA